MTKRFTSMYNEQSDMIQYVDTLKEEPNKWSICNVSETLKKLNELHEEIEYLKPLANENTQYIDDMEDDIITFKQKAEKLEKENEQLRTALKELKEIGDYQADRIQELNDENEQLKETNQELYDFRLVLNALLFNEWAETGKYEVYKSKRHHDGELCFDGDWFIVVAILPLGQVTNHYHIKYWDYFKIPSYERVKDEFDGHTSCDVLERLKGAIK